MLVVIGPSGAGKSTVVRVLAARGLLAVHPTWTTRPRRPDEHDDTVEHVFVTEEEFTRREADGFFVGTAEPFGLPHRYGLPHFTRRPSAPGGDDGVDTVMLRAPMVEQFSAVVGRPVVYQIENAAEHAAANLAARGDSPAEAGCRLDGFAEEVRLGEDLARRVFVNDGDLDELIDRIDDAVRTDFGLARAPAPERRARRAAPPPPAPRDPGAPSTIRRVLTVVFLTLFGVAAMAGVLVLAFILLLMMSLSNWSSNK